MLAAALALTAAGAAPALAATTLDLGTAGSFAVLAGSGITNTGRSTIAGDIGTSPLPDETGTGACGIGNANCVDLTGSNHPADGIALQAKKDLTKAFDDAAGQPADDYVTADLAGKTFTAGVYNATSSMGLSGEVTLDGQGVQDSVFIFQIGSTLTTASGSMVTLINGASACNVFWQVGSAATLGSGSTFRGTILAHDSISLNDAVTVMGRLLGGEQDSGEGAVTLIHDTITVPSCSAASSTGGGTGGTTGGTSGSSTGSSTSGTTGASTSGGTSSGTSAGTGGGTGSATGGTASGTSTSGTTGGTAGTTTSGTAPVSDTAGTASADSADSARLQSLPFSGSNTAALAGFGLLALVAGGILIVASRPVRPGLHAPRPARAGQPR